MGVGSYEVGGFSWGLNSVSYTHGAQGRSQVYQLMFEFDGRGNILPEFKRISVYKQ